MTETKEIKSMNVEIQLDDAVANGQYVNMIMAQHSSSEFVFDFIFMLPGQPKGRVRSRVIMAPEHAKRLMMMLNEGIANYENIFGAIRLPQGPLPLPRNVQ